MSNHWLRPKWDSGLSINMIPHEFLIKKGIQLLMLDVDGTLLPRNEIQIHPSVISWINIAMKHHNIHLISNNISKARISNIAKQVELTYTYAAGKPRRKSLLNAINRSKVDYSKIAIIGDRLFTDMLAGNRLGIYTILVKQIDTYAKPKTYDHIQTIEKCLASLLGGL